ncbi:MAG: Nif3-like dinuclear metal center hexameric protein [Planctomycetota bacterium]|nr:MAG: Nif3-like dinuclear metal center hexameric protein [Planctomycetota bacterium]
MHRDDLQRHCSHLLDSERFHDYCPNGLQVEGGETISVIATACTASRAAIEAACAGGAQALLVHHGIIWGKAATPITGMLKQRLAPLLAADCSLLAYHLPLDAHPQYGNNAVLLHELGLNVDGSFGLYHGQNIGLFANLQTEMSLAELSQRLEVAVSHPVLHCPGANANVQRIGMVTGGGQSLLLDAAAAGCDVLITGEASEQTWHEAQESGCHCLAAGHHATESIAIHRLGASIAESFGLRHLPIDIPNPV